MGTPAFAVPSLRALAESSDVAGVFSQPAKPQGRGMRSAASPVAAEAAARGIPVLNPTKLRNPDVLPTLREWDPDIIVVAAYGKILPPAILSLPRVAAINVHASLLPRHRGAAPIAAAILAGDERTGVTIMLMSEGMDEGDVLLRHPLAIAPDDTTATLTVRLAALGATALGDALARLRGEGLVAEPQDPAFATYAPRLTRDDGRVRWTESADGIARRVRAFTPWPSAFTTLRGRTVKLLEATVGATGADRADTAPGTIQSIAPSAIRVHTGGGTLDLLRLQAEGRKALPAREFAAGARLAPGDRFE